MSSRQSSEPEVSFLTAENLTHQNLPSLSYQNDHRTTTVAWHDIHFTGKLESWCGFEEEVLDFCRSIDWKRHEIPLECNFQNDKLNALRFEEYRCGEEISVNGRFAQHALQVNSVVGKELGYSTTFGDWRACTENKTTRKRKRQPLSNADKTQKVDDGSSDDKNSTLVPDFALLHKVSCTPRAIGEGKTPWAHNLKALWNIYQSGGNTYPLRQALGQLSHYMLTFQLKYAFLTTYELTIFVKQEKRETGMVLFCSQPIPNDALPTDKTPSVRQSILFIQGMVETSDWHAHNEMEASYSTDDAMGAKWVAIRDSNEGVREFRLRIAAVEAFIATESLPDFQQALIRLEMDSKDPDELGIQAGPSRRKR